MKQKFSVSDRLIMLGLLPSKGSYATQRMVADLSSKLGFTSKELKSIDYKQEGNSARWDMRKDPMKEITLDSVEEQVFIDALTELDKKNELERRHVSLYQKFVEK